MNDVVDVHDTTHLSQLMERCSLGMMETKQNSRRLPHSCITHRGLHDPSL